MRTASALQVVRRCVQDESRRSTLEQSDRRADRAQLASRQRTRSRRRRTWTQTSGRDRDADRGAPRSRSGAEYRHGSGNQVRPLRKHPRASHPAHGAGEAIGGPLVWTFDGPFATSLADLEDALRRAIVQVGDVSGIAVLIELSLPSVKRRVDAGDAVQPAWTQFLERVSNRYGLPGPPRVRHARA